MKLSEVVRKSKKKNTENSAGKGNIIGSYIWKQCSYIVTWFFLFTNLTPNNISFISMVFPLLGFAVMCVAHTTSSKILGVVFFMLWAIFDCVDGNVARIKKQFSPIGDLWDATAGYVAMSLMFLGIGICSYDYSNANSLIYVIFGSLTAICSLLPRLLMHFKYHGGVNEINDMRNYGILKMIVFNISSPDCFVLPLMVIAIVLHLEHLYISCYFAIYLLICVYTCANLLKE